MPQADNTDSEERTRRNAHLLAEALEGKGVWSGLPTKRKVGVVLFVVGAIALPVSFLPLEPGGWFWGLLGLLFMLIGGALAYSGIDNPSSPWPPYGPG